LITYFLLPLQGDEEMEWGEIGPVLSENDPSLQALMEDAPAELLLEVNLQVSLDNFDSG
jgi:hypothetical protein